MNANITNIKDANEVIVDAKEQDFKTLNRILPRFLCSSFSREDCLEAYNLLPNKETLKINPNTNGISFNKEYRENINKHKQEFLTKIIEGHYTLPLPHHRDFQKIKYRGDKVSIYFSVTKRSEHFSKHGSK